MCVVVCLFSGVGGGGGVLMYGLRRGCVWEASRAFDARWQAREGGAWHPAKKGARHGRSRCQRLALRGRCPLPPSPPEAVEWVQLRLPRLGGLRGHRGKPWLLERGVLGEGGWEVGRGFGGGALGGAQGLRDRRRRRWAEGRRKRPNTCSAPPSPSPPLAVTSRRPLFPPPFPGPFPGPFSLRPLTCCRCCAPPRALRALPPAPRRGSSGGGRAWVLWGGGWGLAVGRRCDQVVMGWGGFGGGKTGLGNPSC